jgi:hypothetical protein
MKHNDISSFWTWFGAVADKLASNAEDNSLLTALDKRIRKLDPRLSWARDIANRTVRNNEGREGSLYDLP